MQRWPEDVLAGGSRDEGRSVTSRVFAILSVFDEERNAHTLTQLSVAAGLPLSTAHRLVAELEAWGGLTRRADGAYEIGRKLWQLGTLAHVSRSLRDAALPLMQDLSAATGENVHLAVRDGLRALYVDRISGSSAVRVASRQGGRLPLHATAVGKVLLASSSDDVQLAALGQLTRVTRYSVVDPGRLRRELHQVRRLGYARTAEEMTLGTCSLAVPVVAGDEEVVAALGVVVASSRRNLIRLLPALQIAAAGIGRGLSPTPYSVQ